MVPKLRLLIAALLAIIAMRSGRAQNLEPLPNTSETLPGPSFPSAFDDLAPDDTGPILPGPAFADSPIPRRFERRAERWNSPSSGYPWVWQLMPDGLVWRSYLAGVKQPRLGVVMTRQSGFGTIWDSVLGGRVSLLRYGTPTAYRPEGFEVQLAGAVFPRIQPDLESSPLVSADFNVSIPVAYAYGPWQFKTGYYHISSHLGDEFMILNPTVTRINYTRDAIMFAVGYFYTEALRLYAEFDYAAGVSGGAEPGEFQFGFDYSPAVRRGAPFLAAYGNLREEVDYGGFFVVQTGWQWRGGPSMHTLRLGVEYLNGQSPQFEFFNTFEQHVGFGVWYDY